MKHSKLSVIFIALGLFIASNSASAVDGYIYCTILADTGSNNYKHILQKNIIKADVAKDPKINEKIVEQYVAFVKEKHPDWYQGFRVNTTAEIAESKMRANTQCNGYHATLKAAKDSQDAVIKYRSERYNKDKSNGPVVIDDEFFYKP